MYGPQEQVIRSFATTREQAALLRHVAAERDMSASAVVRVALRRELTRDLGPSLLSQMHPIVAPGVVASPSPAGPRRVEPIKETP